MDIFDKAIEYLKSIEKQSGEYLFFDELPAELSKAEHSAVKAVAEIATTKQVNEQKTESIPAVSKPAPQAIKQIAIEQVKTQNDDSIDGTWAESKSIDELRGKICNCLRCSLGATRTKFVFGEGNPNADIMIIGEAPGADEDMQGEPFVGRAGQLLTKILEAINIKREDVFIGNIIKCRPPANRRPTTQEVATCDPYLKKQIQLIKPKFILALGLTAAETMFGKNQKMGDIRGKLFDYHGIQTLVTYHPAALLRNPAWKKPVWEDVQILRKLYDDYLNNKKEE